MHIMLEPLLGNKTSEKILLYLHVYGEGYSRLLSRVFGMSVSGVYQQLRRLEDGGVIVGFSKGRTRIFKLNPRYPFRSELAALLRKALQFVSEDTKEQYFRGRTRPRRTGKPV
ncbi:MAG: winged helix-turn-helix domain-containing protein [Candidatus Aureabacteria bacterium]|nr:winged helix-turn-helix domain-containing protein [Candidatus Auribacterota bacterium]